MTPGSLPQLSVSSLSCDDIGLAHGHVLGLARKGSSRLACQRLAEVESPALPGAGAGAGAD